MNHEESIARLVENGILTEEQAKSLKESLSPSPNIKEAKNRKKLFLATLVVGLVFLVITAAFYMADGDGGNSIQMAENVSETLNTTAGIGTMNSVTSGIIAIAIFLIFPILLFVWLYNGLVSKEEEVKSGWAQVESNYQRRADLIPNLVETVSKYMKHESDTLQKVTDKRTSDVQDTVAALVAAQDEGAELLKESAGKVPTDEAYLSALNAAQQRVGSMMYKLLATVENYPELRASDQMLQLQAQLEGTENRINVARMRFNEAVADFNTSTRHLPASLIASLGNFQRKAYFKSDGGAENAVSVSFD